MQTSFSYANGEAFGRVRPQAAIARRWQMKQKRRDTTQKKNKPSLAAVIGGCVAERSVCSGARGGRS